MKLIEKIGTTFVGLTGISFAIVLFVLAAYIPFVIVVVPIVMAGSCAVGYFIYQIWKIWTNKF